MATGDLEGNLERLRVQLRTIGYPHPVDMNGLREGNTASILPLLHYALLGYSRHVSRYLSENGYALFAKSDSRFVEYTLKYLREEYAYRCPLTVAQIFSRGFAERKILLVYDVIQVCKRKHSELVKQARQAQQARKIVRRDATMCNIVKNVDATTMDTLHVDEALSLALEKVLHAHRQASDKITTELEHGPDFAKQTEEVSEIEESQKDNANTQVKMNSKSSDEDTPPRSVELPMSNTRRHTHKNIDTSNVDPSLSHCYDKLRTQIVEVAEKLEKLIFTLKEDVENMASGMQIRLTSLESQARYLEQAIPLKSLIERKRPTDYSSLQPYIYNPHVINPSRTNLLHSNPEQISTRELISNIKARCNQTRELLYGP
ncbi:hypothetical protein GOP47_0002821 [Adiantum capillus-veneris]|uniref:Centrosomal protein of 44 kDa n=1 Tax=Adiantum capillus-veneris TaxID=13818 RepID=A0A9D4ZPH6_ADICA|nr:hypothetical protein GOP47_0002821 [Adiantum capillus-veneris]